MKNDWHIMILGSGTAIPKADRGSPSVALFLDRDPPVLVDMGPGTLRQLTLAGIDYEKVSHIFLTHFHPDHTLDLAHFLFASKNPSVLERRRPFVLSGPTGLQEFLRAFEAPYGSWLTLPPRLMAVEEFETRGPFERDYGLFRVRSLPVQHTPNSLAYRFEAENGKSVVISGDTGFCEEMVDLAMDADLLILECAFPEGEGMEGHLTPSEAGRIATLARVPRLVLTHFYPQILMRGMAQDCRRTYHRELILAEDLLRIRV